MMRIRLGLVLAVVMTSAGAMAFPEIPKASAKALGVTRGKPFSSGFVFVNGKFLKPPYVVERWGTGIRVNQVPVTGQVIEWDEFLKTQSGVKMSKSEAAPAPVAAPAPSPTPPQQQQEVAAEEITASNLDALFDDAPMVKKSSKPAARMPVVSAAPPKPKVTISYSLDGDFVENSASKQLVGRINTARTEIDRQLRAGGFIFFGDRYSRVVGDARTASQMINSLPEVMQRADSAASLLSAARSANLYYLNEMIADELYRNRFEYRTLQERRNGLRRNSEINSMLRGSSSF